VAGFLIFPVPLLLVPLATGPQPVMLVLLFTAEFLSSLGVMLLDITAGSIQTALTPTTLLARVAGVRRTVNYGIRPIGALLGGMLGATLGVLPTLWIGAIGGTTATLWLLRPAILRMRTLPERATAS
jgi:predicted MFS family arabinose efflux permease